MNLLLDKLYHFISHSTELKTLALSLFPLILPETSLVNIYIYPASSKESRGSESKNM